jgi:CMP-N,N'-diacetyllegionaminic acid synthase
LRLNDTPRTPHLHPQLTTGSLMTILAIVPARGGSKSIPGKNLRIAAGKPLIVWSIEQALAATLVDRVLVSTDNPEIAQVARRAGAEAPFLRPGELATDTAPTEPVLLHALDWLAAQSGYSPTAVLLLQPTCPVRRTGTLDRAIRQFIDRGADSLLSVREIHPFLWRGEQSPKASYDFMNRPRRQDVASADRLFEETGSIYITKTSLLRRTGNRLGGEIALFRMDGDESWDIDVEADLSVVDALLSKETRV